MSQASELISQIHEHNRGQILATLVRVLGDFDLAEEAIQDAFITALESWTQEGVPQNPVSWLVSTGRFKAIDKLRRKQFLKTHEQEILKRFQEIDFHNSTRKEYCIEDDQLRLIFACCHPAIDQQVQIALTLREIAGLTTEQIANAFLTTTSTMAQRLVRGKAKIRDAGIPIGIPREEELSERLDSVLSVLYLIFNEGYASRSDGEYVSVDLSQEAIRLCRLVLSLLPETEVKGLLALMLLHDSRRPARIDAQGQLVLLEDQDRTRWNAAQIDEGTHLVNECFASGTVGFYSLQAALSSVHSGAQAYEQTDWDQLVQLYDLLLVSAQSPVIEMNRAIAVSMRDGPDAGLDELNRLADEPALKGLAQYSIALADCYRRKGAISQALKCYEHADELTTQSVEKQFLNKRITELKSLLSKA